MYADIKPGDRVHVEFDAVVQKERGGIVFPQTGPAITTLVKTEDGDASRFHYVYLDDSQAVTKLPPKPTEVKPEWWPPKPGDVFEHVLTHSRYFVTYNGIYGSGGGRYDAEDFGHTVTARNRGTIWKLLVASPFRENEAESPLADYFRAGISA